MDNKDINLEEEEKDQDLNQSEDLEKEENQENEDQNTSDELDKLNEKFLRVQADFSNYKRRVEKEKESIYAFANEKLVGELLDVMDNFERAFSSSDEEVKNDSFYEGVSMVYKQLSNVLEKNGLEVISAMNEKFDPNLHHAVMQEESEDLEENTVIDVFQKGYKLKNKVIRPSMVKVSK